MRAKAKYNSEIRERSNHIKRFSFGSNLQALIQHRSFPLSHNLHLILTHSPNSQRSHFHKSTWRTSYFLATRLLTALLQFFSLFRSLISFCCSFLLILSTLSKQQLQIQIPGTYSSELYIDKIFEGIFLY